MRSSQAAFNLIVKEEVSSEATYRKKYQRPEWPGVQSGATIGIGYDLGQTDRKTILADWNGRVRTSMVDAMLSCSGKTGAAGKVATAQVRNQIEVSWETALAVHKECVVPRWEARLTKALPNADKLHPDCFGALLSLIFNRGTSFNTAGDRYAEMRAIKGHMRSENFAAIPAEFRRMKRIWPGVPGLQARREREAKLFEKGLNAKPPIKRPPPDIEPTKPAAKSGIIQKALAAIAAAIGTAIESITGALGDWRVLSIIASLIVVGLLVWIIYERHQKSDVSGWFK